MGSDKWNLIKAHVISLLTLNWLLRTKIARIIRYRGLFGAIDKVWDQADLIMFLTRETKINNLLLVI